MTAERDFGRTMRVLRTSLGMSQADMAQRLTDHGIHVDATAVLRMEKGPRQIRLNEAVAVAAVLGHSVDNILQAPIAEGPALSLLRLVGDRLRQMADELDGGTS